MIIYFTGIVNGAGPGSPFELIMGAAAPGRAYPAMLRPPPFLIPPRQQSVTLADFLLLGRCSTAGRRGSLLKIWMALRPMLHAAPSSSQLLNLFY